MPQRPLICLTSKDAVVGLPEGWPSNRNDFIRFYNGHLAYTLDLIANYGNKRLAYRLATGDWDEIATATPPQKFSLPLSAGWETQSGGDAKYFKTQEDIVHVSMNVKSNAAVAAGDTIATLPAGFRPASQLKIPIICKVSGQSALKFGHFDVTTNGAIRIYDAVTGSEIVTEIAVAPFTFDAAS